MTEAKKFIDVASVEARSFPRGVGVVRLMGRDAGFLAVHACLAAPGDVDACLVPEKSFSVDALLRYVTEKLDEKDHCILVVAEGVNTRVIDGNGPVTVDGDVGPWLCAQLKANLESISEIRGPFLRGSLRPFERGGHDFLFAIGAARGARRARR